MNAWIFDVDGVLVHLKKRQIVEKKLLTYILSLLQKGDVIVFISGRSTAWQHSNLITLLKKEAQRLQLSLSLLNNVFLSGEFGGTSIYFQQGKEYSLINKKHIIPQEVLHHLAQEAQPLLGKFVLEPKDTIFTVYTKSLETFSKDKIILAGKFKSVIKTHNLQDKLEVHVDSTAINVRYKKATKAYAIDQVISWLQKKDVDIDKFIVLGDSLSDLEMGEELKRLQLQFTFAYVGDRRVLRYRNLSFPLSYTKNKYDKGALEYLTTLL